MLWELLTADIQRIWVRSTQFLGKLLDTFVDVRHRIDTNDTRVCRWEERLHHYHVIWYGCLVLYINAVVLRIRGGRFLHRLRILTFLRHLIRFQDHLVIAPTMVIP